jgi:tetratricopeptide (TPR) repeat protein
MTFKKYTRVLLATLSLMLVACGGNDTELSELNQRADSLSIKLNSPVLKAVNAELLKDPNNADLYHKRAAVYLDLRQHSAAVGDALRAIRLDSTRSDFYMTLVNAYFAQNKTRQAKDLLEIMESKFPENTETLLKLGELYYLVQQYQKGIEYVNKALKIDERLAKAYYIKGSIYRESGDTAKAVSSLQTAIEQDSKYEDAFIDLGIIFSARKNELGLEYYDNALRLNPSNENTRYARAKFLQDLGRYDEAINEYESMLSKNPSCENCLYNLGAIHLEIKKDNKSALQYFTKAIQVNPAYVEAYLARGFTYSRLKDKESAMADYKTCLKIEPNYEPALQGLKEL